MPTVMGFDDFRRSTILWHVMFIITNWKSLRHYFLKIQAHGAPAIYISGMFDKSCSSLEDRNIVNLRYNYGFQGQ
jgi:hypothetical protein